MPDILYPDQNQWQMIMYTWFILINIILKYLYKLLIYYSSSLPQIFQ